MSSTIIKLHAEPVVVVPLTITNYERAARAALLAQAIAALKTAIAGYEAELARLEAQ